MWNSTVNAGTNVACLRAHGRIDAWKCLMAQYALPYIKTPFFLMNSAVDLWQIEHILGLHCMPAHCSQGDFEHIERYREVFLAALAPVTASAANGIYINSCYMHGQSVYYCNGHPQSESGQGRHAGSCQGWLSQTVHGVTPQQAFLQYYISNGEDWSPTNFNVDMSPWRLTPACAFPEVTSHKGKTVKNIDFFLRSCEEIITNGSTTMTTTITTTTTTTATARITTGWHLPPLALGVGVVAGFVAGLAVAWMVRNGGQLKSYVESYCQADSHDLVDQINHPYRF